MSTSKSILIVFQVCIVALFGLVRIYGNKNKPHLIDMATVQLPDQPIRLVFDRPVNIQEITKSLVVYREEVPISATVSWRGNAVLIESVSPLLPGSTYTVRIPKVSDSLGQSVENFEYSVAPSQPIVAFQSSVQEVRVYNLVTKVATSVFTGERILGIAPDFAGGFYITDVKGVFHAVFTAGSWKVTQKNPLPGQKIVSLRTCDEGKSALLAAQRTGANGAVTQEGVYHVAMNSGELTSKVSLLQLPKLRSLRESLRCSPYSSDILSTTEAATTQLHTIQSPDQLLPLGNKRFLYGFSSDSLLVGDVSGPTFPLARRVEEYRLSGEVALRLSNDSVDYSEPSKRPGSSMLAVQQSPVEFTVSNGSSIGLYADGVSSVIEESGYDYTRPRWSPDGRYLLVEKSIFADAGREIDQDGLPLSGELVLVNASDCSSVACVSEMPEIPLGITGGAASWLY